MPTIVRTNWNTSPRMFNSIAGWSHTGTGVTQTPTVNGTQIDFASNLAGGTFFLFQANPAPAAPGQSWGGSYEVSVPLGSPAVTLYAAELAYGGATNAQAGSFVVVNPGETKTVTSGINLTPSGTTGTRTLLYIGSALTAPARLLVRNAMHEKDTAVGVYFDGSFGSSPGVAYAWTGTPDDSTSTKTVSDSIDTMGPGKKMWFGTEKRMQAVPLPASGMELERGGVYEEMVYDNGRLGSVRRMQTHQRFNMNFGVQEASGLTGLDVFQKFASGFYGDCDVYPIFFADPMNYDQNLFPPNWAAPGLIERGWANIGDETSGLYYNFAENPSVEVDTTNWAAIAGTSGVAAGARVNGNFASGRWCYRVTWSTATTAVSGGLSVIVGVQQSTTGNFRIAIHPSKTQRVQMSVTWRDASNIDISTVTGTARVMTTSNELPMEMLNLATPANAVTARIEVRAVAGTSGTNWAIGDYIEGDGVMSSPYWAPGGIVTMDGITPTYFDGSTPGAEWQETPHASQSSMFVPAFPPTFSDTPANNYELPPRQATIQVTTPANALPSYSSYALIPVPPGYTLWLGATGSSASAVTSGIRVWGYNTPSVEASPVTTATLTMLSSTGAQRLNYSVSGATVQFVKVFLNRTTLEAGSLVISSMMAQLWPTGMTPPLATSGNFIEGRGHRGLKFADGANAETYVIRDPGRTTPIHYKALSTQLVEAQEQG